MKKTMLASAVLVVAALMVSGIHLSAQNADKIRVSGWALNFGNTGTGANATIDITIDKWSTVAQRDRLIGVFMEKKQKGLLDALQDEPEIGRWRFPGYMGPDPSHYRLGTPIRYAMRHPGEDGGSRIVIITDRIIGFQEARNNGRSMDYPFTLMEMHFDKAGKGIGKMAMYTQIDFNKKKNVIEIENWGSEPVRLNELKLEVKK